MKCQKRTNHRQNYVHKVQRLAGGLNWPATRTRPDISFVVSQLSSAAKRAPLRAVALGKRCLRYLAGTREHGIHVGSGQRCQGSGPELEAHGDASYEVGVAQTGVLAKLDGMTISWEALSSHRCRGRRRKVRWLLWPTRHRCSRASRACSARWACRLPSACCSATIGLQCTFQLAATSGGQLP